MSYLLGGFALVFRLCGGRVRAHYIYIYINGGQVSRVARSRGRQMNISDALETELIPGACYIRPLFFFSLLYFFLLFADGVSLPYLQAMRDFSLVLLQRHTLVLLISPLFLGFSSHLGFGFGNSLQED